MKFWPSLAELHEHYEIVREQAARKAREEERRAADAAADTLPRLALREIPAVRDYLARQEVVVGIPEEGKGDCSDCGQQHPALYRIGKFRVCTECARKRLRARALDITDDAAASG